VALPHHTMAASAHQCVPALVAGHADASHRKRRVLLVAAAVTAPAAEEGEGGEDSQEAEPSHPEFYLRDSPFGFGPFFYHEPGRHAYLRYTGERSARR
jgi:hypothetical protein